MENGICHKLLYPSILNLNVIQLSTRWTATVVPLPVIFKRIPNPVDLEICFGINISSECKNTSYLKAAHQFYEAPPQPSCIRIQALFLISCDSTIQPKSCVEVEQPVAGFMTERWLIWLVENLKLEETSVVTSLFWQPPRWAKCSTLFLWIQTVAIVWYIGVTLTE